MSLDKGYFRRVTKQTPTKLWINNPTPEETDKAIAAGAISCTTNPTYSMKQILAESERNYVLSVIDDVIKETEDNSKAADLIQQKLAKRIMDKFLPLYEQSPGKQGFVSIQGNPLADDDPDHIIDEALRYRKVGKNFIAKIPVVKAGSKAIEALIPEDMPMIATEVMGIAQAVRTCELYQRVSKECGKHPPFYLTHITGIFDEHLKNVVKRDSIKLSPDVLWQAGCIVARKQYKIFKERGYPGTMLGGGARGLHHFTEMVGADIHITINWIGTADRLIESDPPVVYRINTPAPQYVIDELLAKSFVKGWNYLLKTIEDRREKIS